MSLNLYSDSGGSDANSGALDINARQLKVLNIIPGVSARGGGVLSAASRHHHCLLAHHIDSYLFTRGEPSADFRIHTYSGEPRHGQRILNRLHFEWLKLYRKWLYSRATTHALSEGFSDGRVHDGKSIVRYLPMCDIAHVHLLDSFIGYKWFFRWLPAKMPVVWTLHDNMPLTGGCQSNFGCEQYVKGCGNCPQLHLQGPNDGSRQGYRRKQTIFDRVPAEQITFVSASRVQCEMARRSPMTRRFEVLHVPLSLDIQRFRPGDRAAAKQALGVAGGKLAVGFASSSLGRPNKGFAVLARAIRETPGLRDRIVLVLIGMYQRNGVINEDFASLECEKVALGWVDAESELIRAYQAMDLFVAPSYQESCGQTVMEAMACGLAVLGSDIGGIQDQVVEGENGHLFPPGESAPIAALLRRYAEDPGLVGTLGAQARQRVERNSSYAVIGAQFTEIYRNALHKLGS